jgi:exodeoxyribonuclease V gamma subunit
MESLGKCQIVVSNKLEDLATSLISYLENKPVFEKKIVLIPSQEQKNFLLFTAANQSKKKIACGINFFSLTQFLSYLLEREGKGQRIPSKQQLELSLEYALLEVFSAREIGAQFKQLEGYLKEKKEVRIRQISSKLASLFLEYGTYGKPFLEEWLKKDGWQQCLWKKVFGSVWTTPLEVCGGMGELPFEVHLFGFLFLPQLFQSFFQRQHSFFYLLSPSPLFLGDVMTPRENLRMQKLQEKVGVSYVERKEFETYAKEQNALVANNSRLGKRLFALLDDDATVIHDHYADPPQAPQTLLEQVQAEIYHLSSLHQEGKGADLSLQVHGTVSKKREVEVLASTILEFIEKGLEPKEIVVMAPQIQIYAPLLEMVLERVGLRVAIEGKKKKSSATGALMHLLSLKRGRFEKDEVLKLFSYACFLAKLGLTEEEGARFCRWIRKANVIWGFDAEHRKKILGSTKQSSSVGTWEFGFDRLLWGLALVKQEEDAPDLPVAPLACVEAPEAEKLGVAIGCLKSMWELFNELETKPLRSLKEWSCFLRALTENYFVLSSEEEDELERFKKQTLQLSHLTEPLFSFEAFYQGIATFFESHGSGVAAYDRQMIRCLNLKPGNVTPVGALCLLGMQEGSFPRLETKNPFCDALFDKLGDYRPSGADRDRTELLNLLISARKHIVFSYQNHSAEDGKEQGPSILLEELLSYLSNDGIIKQHPVSPYDLSYFQPQTKLKSYFLRDYEVVLANSGKKEKLPAPFFTQSGKQEQHGVLHKVSVQELRRFARHPIQYYLNRVLGIYLHKEEEGRAEFLLSPMQKGLLRKYSLRMPLDTLLSRSELTGTLPLWGFSKVAKEALRDEVKSYHQTLQDLGVTIQELFSVELRQDVLEPQWISERLLRHPPLELSDEQGLRVSVTGTFGDVAKEGLLFHGKDNVEDQVRGWPEILIFSQLDLGNRANKRVLFTKNGKGKELDPEELKVPLQSYLNYYVRSMQTMSPLMPKWAESLLKGDDIEFEKKVQASLSQAPGTFEDPYLKWLFAKEGTLETKTAYQQWAPYLQEAFDAII